MSLGLNIIVGAGEASELTRCLSSVQGDLFDEIVVTLTSDDEAVTEVKSVLRQQGLSPADTYLRVGVKGGGCGGPVYALGLTAEKTEHDDVFECDGIRVVCDPKSHLSLNGTVIGFQDGLMGRGFTFKNPNATHTCGCASGSST